jgi:hypothetical protein
MVPGSTTMRAVEEILEELEFIEKYGHAFDRNRAAYCQALMWVLNHRGTLAPSVVEGWRRKNP